MAFIYRPLVKSVAFIYRPLLKSVAFIYRPLVKSVAFIYRPLAKSVALIYRPLVKSVYQKKNSFLTSQPKPVVGTQKNCLNETVLLSTQNTC